MPSPTWRAVLRGGYVALAATDSVLAGSGPRARSARRLTKPLLMPLLAGSVVAGPPSALRRTVLAAEGAGWVGDLLLLGEGTRAFAGGAASFGVGHAAYVGGLRRLARPGSPYAAPAGRGVAALAAVAVPVLARGAHRKAPVLAVAVAGYSALLATTAAYAVHTDAVLPSPVRRRLAAGGLLFLASDTMLGLREFVVAEPPAWLERAVMASYASAQVLLAEGLSAAGQALETSEPTR